MPDDDKKPKPVPPVPEPPAEPPGFLKYRAPSSTKETLRAYIADSVYGENVDIRLQALARGLGLGAALLPEGHELAGQVQDALLMEVTPLTPRVTLDESGRFYEVSSPMQEKSVSICAPSELESVVKRQEYQAKVSRWQRLSIFMDALVARLTELGILNMEDSL